MAEKISIIASDFQSQLSGAISVGATSFTIQSVLDSDGDTLSDGIYCFTIDRDNTSAKEYLVGQLTSATKTVSSISSVDRQGNLTANAQKAHRIGANVIISDHSILSSISKILRGVGKLDPAGPLEYDTAPTLSSATQIATKGYVDSVVTGGTVNTDRIILGSQTAGETVAAGNIVYFKSSDSRWWLADADLTATFTNVQLGVALGSGTAGNVITDGVLIYGKCDSFTGLTATATYYLSNTAGGVSTSAGTNTIILGQAFSTTGIFVNPSTSSGPTNFVSTSAGVGDAGKGVVLNGSGLIDQSMVYRSIIRQYDVAGSPHTWTKPTGLVALKVMLWGGGGSGGGATGSFSAGGGGGGHFIDGYFVASKLGATETITVGAGGASVGGSSLRGNNGANSTFGSLLTGYGGGKGGGNSEAGGGGGGLYTAGDYNVGGAPAPGADTYYGGGASSGGRSIYGGGGGGGGGPDREGGASTYGGGGGASGGSSGTPVLGGTSKFGGGGGQSTSTVASNGSVPGGGGGGSRGTVASGAGGAGRCIVIEYYN